MEEEPENPGAIVKSIIEVQAKQKISLDHKNLTGTLEKLFGHRRLKGAISEDVKDKGGSTDHPTRFDWRNVEGKNYVSHVKLQGLCNSCAAFGVAAAVETSARFEEKIAVTEDNKTSLLDLSEQQMFYTNDMYPDECNCEIGWFVDNALDFSRDTGLVPEKLYPYNPYNPFYKPPIKNLPQGWKSTVTKISAYTAYTDPERMKNHLSTKGPLVASIDMYWDLLFYRSGIFEKQTEKALGGHCISCIGYDDEKQAWLCKNSWGDQWGDEGFFWMKYGDCSIDDLMWGIDGFEKIFVDGRE
ncbi:MAG: C39 family peptidase [Spirochaetaceae bacterium]|nr:C39 family peptidase [Spirochaetaceae bacterium]